MNVDQYIKNLRIQKMDSKETIKNLIISKKLLKTNKNPYCYDKYKKKLLKTNKNPYYYDKNKEMIKAINDFLEKVMN